MREVFRAKPGGQYTLRCGVKIRGATGHTYPLVAWHRHQDEYVDADWLERYIRPEVEFWERHQVPVYCGEFGCAQPPSGDGVRWVADVASILNRYDQQPADINGRRALREIEHFDSDRAILIIIIQDDARRDLF